MSLCYAPFPLAPALVARFRDAGIEVLTQRFPVQDGSGAPSISLSIYDSPDRVLQHWRQQPDPPSLHQLLEGFQSLLAQPPGGAVISLWRLEQLDPARVHHWLSGLPGQASHPGSISAEPPPIDPLSAQLVLALLQDQPALLDRYLDLELKGELAGTTPDSHYLERLQRSVSSASLLTQWWALQTMAAEQKTLKEDYPRLQVERDSLASQLASIQAKDEQMQEETRLLLLQLQQVQKELEHLFQSSRNYEQLQEERDSLASQLASIQAKDEEMQEETRLLLLQLQQAQKELEHVFQSSQESEQKVEQQAQALKMLAEEKQAEKVRCQALRKERNHLASRLQNCQAKAKEASEESDLLLLQLQQVQQELEHYFLVSREQGVLLDRMDQQLQRALRLLVQAAPQPAPVTPRVLTGAR